MVMKPEPLFDCVDAVRAMVPPPGKVVLLTPQGRLLDQRVVNELAARAAPHRHLRSLRGSR